MSSARARERLNTSRRGTSLPPVMEEGAPYSLPLGQRLPPLLASNETSSSSSSSSIRSTSPRGGVMSYSRDDSASPVMNSRGSPAPRGTITSPFNPSPPPAAYDEALQRGGGRLSRSSSPSPWAPPILDESRVASPIQIQQRRAAESRARYSRDNRGTRSMSPNPSLLMSSGSGNGGGRFSPTPGGVISSSSEFIPQRSVSPSPSYGQLVATNEESSAILGLDPVGGRRAPRGAIDEQQDIQGYDPEQVARLTAIDIAKQLYQLSPTKKLRVEVISGSLDGLRPKDVSMAISFAYDHPLKVITNSKGHETWIFEANSIEIARSIAERSHEDQPLVKGRAKVKMTQVEEYVPPAAPSLAQRVYASFTRKSETTKTHTSATTKTESSMSTSSSSQSSSSLSQDDSSVIVVSSEEEKKNEDEALAAAADVISSSGGTKIKIKSPVASPQLPPKPQHTVTETSSTSSSSAPSVWTMWSPFKKSTSISTAPTVPVIPKLIFTGTSSKEGSKITGKKGLKRFKEVAKKVIESKRVEIEKAKGIERGGVVASLVQKVVIESRAKKLALEAAQREDLKLKTIAVVYPEAAEGDESGVLPAGAPSSFSKPKPPSLIRVATAQLLKLGMPSDYHKQLDETPHHSDDPHAIWDWHNVLGTGEDDDIKAKIGTRDDDHIDEIHRFASSASVSTLTGRAKNKDQFILPVIQRRLAHQQKLLHLGEDEDDKPEDSAFIDVMEELKLHKEKKERGLREMVHSLDERPWDKRKITLLTTATPLSFVGMVLTILAFFIDITAYYSPWVEYKTYARDLQYKTYETTIYRKYMDRNEICLEIDPPGGRSAQSPPPFEGCVPYPLAEPWQRSLDTAMKFAVGMSFFAIVWAFLAQRHIRWWIAEFTSPWAKVPLIVGGITGNCGDEPTGTRRLSTRDCGYICNPFLSALLCFLSALVLLSVFGIFFHATTGTYDMSYRTGAGWLTLVAGGLSTFAAAYLVWSQWIVCPVEHVWHCDLHCHWVQTHVDLEERFLMATPHAEPRQGLPHLLCVTKRMIIYMFEEITLPLFARLWPIASIAAKKAAILATLPPPKEPGPFDKPKQDEPEWLQKYNEKVHERKEKERIKKEKERAFQSPFASLRRSFITKPSLVGRGVNAYVDPNKIYHDPEIASKEHRHEVEVLASKEREAALKWHEIEVRREAERKTHEEHVKAAKILASLKKDQPKNEQTASIFSWMTSKKGSNAPSTTTALATTSSSTSSETGEAKSIASPTQSFSIMTQTRAQKQEKTPTQFDRSFAASPNSEIVDTFIAEEERKDVEHRRK